MAELVPKNSILDRADDLEVDDLIVDDLVVIPEPTDLVVERQLEEQPEEPVQEPFRSSWTLPETSRYCGWRLQVKRGIDVLGAATLLLVLAPIMAIVAIAIALESSGPVLFQQSRIGRNAKPFTMWKFRSMHTDAEARLASDPELLAIYRANDYKFPESNDPRVTRLGGFLRKSSLDELPQLSACSGAR